MPCSPVGPRRLADVPLDWYIDRSRGKETTDHAVAPGKGEVDYGALLPRIRALTSAVGYVEVDRPDDGMSAAAEAGRFIRANGG